MTRQSKPFAEARRAAAVQVVSAGRAWNDFAHTVDRAIRAAGFKLPNPRVPHITKALDDTIKEAECFVGGANDEAGLERAIFLARTTKAMVAIETVKLNRDPKGWLARHFENLEPRRPSQPERSEVAP
jgi:hypothetical protein